MMAAVHGKTTVPMRALALLLGLLPMAASAATLEFGAARVGGDGWQLGAVSGEYRSDGRLRLRAGSLNAAALPVPVESLELDCAKLSGGASLSCDEVRVRLVSAKLGQAQAEFSARFEAPERWAAQLRRLSAQISYEGAGGRIATDKLALEGSGELRQSGGVLAARLNAAARGGQAYVEPVFADFSAQPLQVQARLEWRAAGAQLRILGLEARQDKVGAARLEGELRGPEWAKAHRLDLALTGIALAALVETYVKPFLAGTPVEDLAAAGTIGGRVTIQNAQPRHADLRVERAAVSSERLGAGLAGIDGTLSWNGAQPAQSALRWESGRVGKLALGSAQLRLAASENELRLLAPLRVPVLDGALRVERLVVREPASETRSADFAAAIEPIDLARLSAAFGWPEFAGTVSGTLPGLSYRERELVLDGELQARVFDGEVRVRGLRVIEPLGSMPRVLADLSLRRLDLEQLTGAFSFGRIEGRLDADVAGLRLLRWQPVAMQARLYTPAGDDSRHRISQRAIDTISSIGGGPSGVLSRGVLRFFDDFAYDRIGWSCTLRNGVCRMDGLEDTRDGRGYVIVRGKLLPRIDVIGFTREVAWDTLVERLKNARGAPAPTVERE